MNTETAPIDNQSNVLRLLLKERIQGFDVAKYPIPPMIYSHFLPLNNGVGHEMHVTYALPQHFIDRLKEEATTYITSPPYLESMINNKSASTTIAQEQANIRAIGLTLVRQAQQTNHTVPIDIGTFQTVVLKPIMVGLDDFYNQGWVIIRHLSGTPKPTKDNAFAIQLADEYLLFYDRLLDPRVRQVRDLGKSDSVYLIPINNVIQNDKALFEQQTKAYLISNFAINVLKRTPFAQFMESATRQTDEIAALLPPFYEKFGNIPEKQRKEIINYVNNTLYWMQALMMPVDNTSTLKGIPRVFTTIRRNVIRAPGGVDNSIDTLPTYKYIQNGIEASINDGPDGQFAYWDAIRDAFVLLSKENIVAYQKQKLLKLIEPTNMIDDFILHTDPSHYYRTVTAELAKNEVYVRRNLADAKLKILSISKQVNPDQMLTPDEPLRIAHIVSGKRMDIEVVRIVEESFINFQKAYSYLVQFPNFQNSLLAFGETVQLDQPLEQILSTLQAHIDTLIAGAGETFAHDERRKLAENPLVQYILFLYWSKNQELQIDQAEKINVMRASISEKLKEQSKSASAEIDPKLKPFGLSKKVIFDLFNYANKVTSNDKVSSEERDARAKIKYVLMLQLAILQQNGFINLNTKGCVEVFAEFMRAMPHELTYDDITQITKSLI